MLKYISDQADLEYTREQSRIKLASYPLFHPNSFYVQHDTELSYEDYLQKILPKSDAYLANQLMARTESNITDEMHQAYKQISERSAQHIAYEEIYALFQKEEITVNEYVNVMNSLIKVADLEFSKALALFRMADSQSKFSIPLKEFANAISMRQQTKLRFQTSTQESFYSQASYVQKGTKFIHAEQQNFVRYMKILLIKQRKIADHKNLLTIQKDFNINFILQSWGSRVSMEHFNDQLDKYGLLKQPHAEILFKIYDRGQKSYLDEDDISTMILPFTNDYQLVLENQVNNKFSDNTQKLFQQLLQELLSGAKEVRKQYTQYQFSLEQAFYMISQNSKYINELQLLYYLESQNMKCTKFELHLIIRLFDNNRDGQIELDDLIRALGK